ncbi:hypothetical protein RND81_12G210300 [Saponaria officinalis]|uniref:Uncharacterized protein n=1 Tax=Saponaria officinalis TaxID=3572 RepID=A0AAW1HDJ9_SAPOF
MTINQYNLLLFSTLVVKTLGQNNHNIQQVNFTQTLDHFAARNDENHNFQQRLFVDYSYWDGTGPIFAFFGGENTLVGSLPGHVGLLEGLAQETKGVIVYIEHRFYGWSIPLGDIKKAMANKQVRACLTIGLALEDFKTVILSLQRNISANHLPVVVLGNGYSGALAVYFRIKYPNITVGALASSSPVLLFGTTSLGNGYCSTVSQDFKDFNQTCYKTINGSWAKLDEIASRPMGLSHLSKLFKRCRPLKSVDEIKLELARFYSFAAQHGGPSQLWLSRFCTMVNGGNGDLEGLATALTSTLGYEICFQTQLYNLHSPFDDPDYTLVWEWQVIRYH